MFEELEPRDVLHWFEEISNIPRGSKNEKEISEYMLNFAKERGLYAKRDEVYNVIIKKPATKGLEDGPTIILQGHMDMVCVKTENSKHDFLKDPLKLKVDDGWIRADNTTLGADNGIAVAYCLALLDSKDIPHSNLEILFTTMEELGMGGASKVDGSDLEGKYLINMDGELEGDLLVGCAGAVTMTSTKKITFVKPSLSDHYCMRIYGLKGGHSGMQIENFRSNSIKFVARLLHNLKNVEIAYVDAGYKRNAIPSYAKVYFYTDENSIDEIKKRARVLEFEHRKTDPLMKIDIEKEEEVFDMVWSEKSKLDVLNCLISVPDQVIYMDPEFKGLVQTSISNGVLRQTDDEISLVALLRSTVQSCLDEYRISYETIVNAFGFTLTDDGGYPVWEHDENSTLKNIAVDVYKKIYYANPTVHTIHCGLECGILKKHLPNVDMISFGPTMHDVHTPNERLSIDSVRRVWIFLKELVTTLSNTKE